MQGSEWQLDVYLSSRSNLQALREIDARGASFLRVNGPPDSPTTLDSSCYIPTEETVRKSVNNTLKKQQEQYSSQSCMRVGVGKPLMSQIGFNVA